MHEERRNDIGSKVLTSVVVLLVVTIMGFSINTASSAVAKAQRNEVLIGRIETNQENIKDDIREIKEDVRDIKGNVHTILNRV